MTSRRRRVFAELPPGWRIVTTSGPAWFVTRATLERPDGRRVEWTSRRHRKALGLREAGERPSGAPRAGPSRTSIWLAVLFGVGSLCFAVGSMPFYFDTVDSSVLAWTFFVGSVFFTSAGYLQFRETVVAPAGVFADADRPRGLRALLGWKPHRIAWWATAVQLVGTVFFNVSTFAGTREDLSLEQSQRLIWAPDFGGSICFLVASWLAYAEVNRGVLPRSDRSVGWRIAALNLAGSVAFGLSAVGARYLDTTGEPANIELVNSGTFIGAICFLVGAVLLPVESATDRSEVKTSP